MDLRAFKELYEKTPVEHYPNRIISHPLVSVCVQTYQHGEYIRKCMEGILMQQTDFKFEVLIGEDQSSDGTRDVCIEYAKKYPEKIRLFLHSRNNNISILNKPTGRFNFVYNLFSAHGKYIALCEGDDYWTDPYKLQKQVNFLQNSMEYAICFHPVMILKDGKLTSDYIAWRMPETTGLQDLAKGNYINTPAVVFRNIIQDIPEVILRIAVGDYFLYMLLAKRGKIMRLAECMAVYRVHCGGVHSMMDQRQRYLRWLKMLDEIICEFENKTRVILISQYIQMSVSVIAMRNDLPDNAKVELNQNILKYDPNYFIGHMQELNDLKRRMNSMRWVLKKLKEIITKRIFEFYRLFTL